MMNLNSDFSALLVAGFFVVLLGLLYETEVAGTVTCLNLYDGKVLLINIKHYCLLK